MKEPCIYKNIFCVCAVLLYNACTLHAATIGSNSVVNRFDTQQILQQSDIVAGFASLAAGFKLFDMSTTATFDSFFQVAGQVDFNEGTLVLERDLILHNVAELVHLGNIDGNFHVFKLSPSITLMPTTIGSSTDFTFSDIKLILGSDVLLQDSCITFTGNSLLNGRGCSLTLDSTSSLKVGPNSSLLVKDIKIKGLKSHNFQGLDSSSTFSFENTTLVLDDDLIFDTGFFEVLAQLRIQGQDHAFVYQTDQVSTISTCGKMILDMGTTFSYAPSVSVQQLFRLLDETSQLVLRSATLHADVVGLQLDQGTLIVEGRSFLSSDGTSQMTSIMLDNLVCVKFAPLATLELIKGFHVV